MQPLTPKDFEACSYLGEAPLSEASEFARVPKYGGTGMVTYEGKLYVGSWNGVYVFSLPHLSFETFISNRLMQDIHGIHVDHRGIFTTLTGQDTLVLTGFDGQILDAVTVRSDLSLIRNDELQKTDWRFFGKQHRGSTGVFHFNHINATGKKILLTSRNTSSIVEITMDKNSGQLISFPFTAPVLLHDGEIHEEHYYFTSIDGRLFKCIPSRNGASGSCEQLDIGRVLGRVPNWCRGLRLSADNKRISALIDGRYGTGAPSIVELTNDFSKPQVINLGKIGGDSWASGLPLKYFTGFDLVKLSET
jgi:hypothetical protein